MLVCKIVLTLCCLLACSGSALAEERAETAGRSLAKAQQLFNQRHYAEALQTFERIGNLADDREAQRLYFMALCHLRLSNPDDAYRLFKMIDSRFSGSEAANLSHQYLSARAKIVTPVVESTGTKSAAPAAVSNSANDSIDEPKELAIPFRKTSKGQIIVSVELAGHSVNMIFDTGAEVCLLGRNQIEAANLSDADRGQQMILHAVAGPMRVYQIAAPIKLGALKKTLAVCVQDANMEEGILGQPFLKGYSCIIDNQAGLIRLRRSGFMTGASKLDSFAIPFSLSGDKIVVSAKINGQDSSMCFDTGAFGVCLSKAQAEKLGLKVPETLPDRTRGPNGDIVPSWQLNADISLGPIKKHAFPVRIIESEISFPLLGQNFFGDRIFAVDRDNHEIRFAR